MPGAAATGTARAPARALAPLRGGSDLGRFRGFGRCGGADVERWREALRRSNCAFAPIQQLELAEGRARLDVRGLEHMSSVSSCEATSWPNIASFTRTGPNSAALVSIAWRIARVEGSGPERYGLVALTVVDSFAALASGACALTENYFYTEEAFADYVGHLRADGMLATGRWYLEPPIEMLRTAQLAHAA